MPVCVWLVLASLSLLFFLHYWIIGSGGNLVSAMGRNWARGREIYNPCRMQDTPAQIVVAVQTFENS